MAVSGSTLQVLTSVNLIDAVQNEPIIWSANYQYVKFPHTINSPVIFRTNEQVVANFLVTSLTSPRTCWRRRQLVRGEVND